MGSAQAKAKAQAQALIDERFGNLPVWVRGPQKGPEHYSGFSRAYLYELKDRNLIISKSIRAPGRLRGVRLFNLKSILDYIDSCKEETEKVAA